MLNNIPFYGRNNIYIRLLLILFFFNLLFCILFFAHTCGEQNTSDCCKYPKVRGYCDHKWFGLYNECYRLMSSNSFYNATIACQNESAVLTYRSNIHSAPHTIWTAKRSKNEQCHSSTGLQSCNNSLPYYCMKPMNMFYQCIN